MDEIEQKYDYYSSIFLSEHQELINPNLKVKDIKKLIKEMSTIKGDNFRFKVFFDSDKNCSDESEFWSHLRIRFYNADRYKAELTRNLFITEVYLDLNKKIEELKKASVNKRKFQWKKYNFN